DIFCWACSTSAARSIYAACPNSSAVWIAARVKAQRYIRLRALPNPGPQPPLSSLCRHVWVSLSKLRISELFSMSPTCRLAFHSGTTGTQNTPSTSTPSTPDQSSTSSTSSQGTTSTTDQSSQSTQNTNTMSSSGQNTTIQGCLSASAMADNNFTLTQDQTGTVYTLTGNTADLKSHVGHEVSISGQAVSGNAASANTSSGAPSSSTGSS